MSNPCDAPLDDRRAYAKRLAPQVIKDHGRKKRYSKREIDDSIVNAGLNIDWACWGYILFLDQPSFDALHAGSGETCDYVAMHTEMGGYLAESAKSGSWLPSGFDWSVFDLGSWEWPDISGLFDFDPPDMGGFGDFGGDF